MRLTGLLIAALLALPAAAQDATPPPTTQPPAQVKVEVSPEEITVGGRVEAKLTLVWMGSEPTAEPRFPTWQDRWGGAEVLGWSEVDAFVDQSARRIYRQTVTLTSFEVGEVSLPRVTVALPLAGETLELRSGDGVGFEVLSVLPPQPEDAEADGEGEADGDGGDDDAAEEPLEPRGAAPPVALPAERLFWAVDATLAGLCLLGAWLLARRLGTAAGGEAAAEPLLEPLDEILARLRRLDASAGSEPAHTAVSLALRRFLGRSLGFQAVESTTSEIQRRLRGTPVPVPAAQRAVRLLRDCDQVKFAALEVAPEVTDDRILKSQALAQEIDAGLHPAEPEPDPASSGAAPRPSEATP